MVELLMKRNDVTFSSTITSDKLFNGNLLSLFRKYLDTKKRLYTSKNKEEMESFFFCQI